MTSSIVIFIDEEGNERNIEIEGNYTTWSDILCTMWRYWFLFLVEIGIM